MKLPGVGEVKNKNVAIGAGVVGVIVLYSYMRKKRAVNTGAGAVDPNAIDPETGIPYGQEYGDGGGYYTNASVPNPYVTQTGTSNTGGAQGYTSNVAWLSDAQQVAVNQFGATFALAATGLGKYLAQDHAGLNTSEYQIVSEVVATLGPPPNGGPYRLIQALNPPPNPTPPPTTQPPVSNPAPAPVSRPSYFVYRVKTGDTFTSIAKQFGVFGGSGLGLFNYNLYNAGRSPQDIATLIKRGINGLVANEGIYVPR